MNDDARKSVPEPAGPVVAGDSGPTDKDRAQTPVASLDPEEIGVTPPDRVEGDDVPQTVNTSLIFERS